MIKNIIIDTILGLTFIVTFSYLVHSNKNENLKWSNIIIFICYAPTLYLYLLYILLLRTKNQSFTNGFIINYTLGCILSIVVIIITYYLYKFKFKQLNIFIINLIFISISIILYFLLRLYNLKSISLLPIFKKSYFQ